jgi:DNA sulfur modification protein DndB
MPIGEIDKVLKRKVGDQVYYFGSIASDKIKGVTFVPAIEPSKKTFLQENTQDGYQRPGFISRMRAFRKFLEQNPNSLVPPILISGRNGWKFEPSAVDVHFGKITVDNPAAIIDGQHRVGGYIDLFEDKGEIRPIDFLLLEGLELTAEMREFVVVNSTQKGVPKPLSAFLTGEYLGEEEDWARVAWELNENDDSPFKTRIFRTTASKESLFALHSVAKQVKRTFDDGKFEDFDEDRKVETFIKYWTIISTELDEQWSDIEKLDDPDSGGRKDFQFKLLELTGLIAWSYIAPKILGRSYVEGMGFAWENVIEFVRACGNIDWSKTGLYAGRTGEAGGRFISKEMERLLPPDHRIATQ